MTACSNHTEVSEGIVRCVRCSRPFCANCVVRFSGGAYCLSCKGEQVRDIQSGTAGGMEFATVGRRFGALWLDSALGGVIAAAGMFGIVPLFARGAVPPAAPPGSLMLILMLAFVVLWILYEGLMLQARGQTLGKMAAGIKVVSADGSDLSARQAWGRAVLRQVFYSWLALINYLPALFTKEKTCVHDLVLKTRVVRVRR